MLWQVLIALQTNSRTTFFHSHQWRQHKIDQSTICTKKIKQNSLNGKEFWSKVCVYATFRWTPFPSEQKWEKLPYVNEIKQIYGNSVCQRIFVYTIKIHKIQKKKFGISLFVDSWNKRRWNQNVWRTKWRTGEKKKKTLSRNDEKVATWHLANWETAPHIISNRQ